MGISHGFYYGLIHFCIYMISVEVLCAGQVAKKDPTTGKSGIHH
jgi:hypothetical protein